MTVNSTPILCLPGVACENFDNGTVLCTWKGNNDSSLLFFFSAVSDDPDVAPGHCRNLGCLEFDFFVENVAEAKVLARAAWEKYREQIMAGDIDRLLVSESDF